MSRGYAAGGCPRDVRLGHPASHRGGRLIAPIPMVPLELRDAGPAAAGVGLANFRHEKPWRPPSLLLEADPPRHDAPRRVLSAVLGPRALRALRSRWLADAD